MTVLDPVPESDDDGAVEVIEDSSDTEGEWDGLPDAQPPEPIEPFSSDTDDDETQPLEIGPDDDVAVVPETPPALQDDDPSDDENTPPWIHRAPSHRAPDDPDTPAPKRRRTNSAVGPE